MHIRDFEIDHLPRAEKQTLWLESRAAYLPIASATIEIDTAGLCSANLSALPLISM